MKLIKQTKLFSRQGKSDKVYEVDLCEVADGQYVVNFRYGRRGATLREGAKTTSPVPRDQAETIFDQLVSSRIAKGYVEGDDAPPVATTQSAVLAPADPDARETAILTRIADGHNSRSKWRLSRAIWRAGELGIKKAEPLLHGLVGKEEMTDYCIAWTMGRLGLANSGPVLQQIASRQGNRDRMRKGPCEHMLAVRMKYNQKAKANLFTRLLS